MKSARILHEADDSAGAPDWTLNATFRDGTSGEYEIDATQSLDVTFDCVELVIEKDGVEVFTTTSDYETATICLRDPVQLFPTFATADSAAFCVLVFFFAWLTCKVLP